tara:strand:+ start:134 stop:1129 length:996 start_codon:yes stop_codon:yes gene_type:complete
MGEKRFNTVGSLVLSCNTGLGILAKSFYDNGIIHKVMVVNHSKYQSNKGWYKKEDICVNLLNFLNEVDTLLCFEVPNPANNLDWGVVKLFKDAGKKVVLMPMYESTPFPLPKEVMPDVWLFPSELDRDFYNEKGIEGYLVRVPVDVKSKHRTIIKRFIHNAGSKGSQHLDRNGTELLIKAMPLINPEVEIVIRSRDTKFSINDPRVKLVLGDVPYEDLWEDGDAFIFVESYNGLSLPLQEAYAAGMFVIAGDRYPINTWLPKSGLVEPDSVNNIRYVFDTIQKANYNSSNLADKINYWEGKDISDYSTKGIEWGKKNSWTNLKQQYMDLLK